MELTPAGLAVLVLAALIIFSPGVRVRLVVAAICGTAVAIFATAAALIWDLGGTLTNLANSIAGGFG